MSPRDRLIAARLAYRAAAEELAAAADAVFGGQLVWVDDKHDTRGTFLRVRHVEPDADVQIVTGCAACAVGIADLLAANPYAGTEDA